jgi:hypothetical protein
MIDKTFIIQASRACVACLLLLAFNGFAEDFSIPSVDDFGRPIQIQKAASSDPSQCTAVDLRKQLPAVRNQGEEGWCFAYAAADLASFKLGTPISAVGLANDYIGTHKLDHQPKDQSALSASYDKGGFVYQTLKIDAERGFCTEKDMPSTGENSRSLGILSELARIENFARVLETSMDVLSSPSMKKTYMDICGQFLGVIRETFPKISPSDLEAILSQSTYLDISKNLIDQSCRTRIKPRQNLAVQQYFYPNGSRDDKIAKMNEILNSQNIMAISYNSGILNNPSNPRDVNGGAHASVVVGRRWDKKSNSCQFLVRNSWGKDCSYTTADCQDGNLWIPAASLSDSVREIDFIK